MAIRFSSTIIRGLLGTLCFLVSWPAASQVQTKQSAEHGPATQEVKIERGEVVYVSGNDMMVKMEDGALEAFNGIPDSKTVHVDGKELNIHQLKPTAAAERAATKRGVAVPIVVVFLGAIGGFITLGIIGLFVGAIVLSVGYKLFLAWINEGSLADQEA